MKKKKERDFSTKKVRVGREQFRKHASSDARLLANIGQLKKTVKLSTQSIVVNKDRLNVTSRRLTLAELIGKSRHSSESVQLHALSGILEFSRRFRDDTRLNLFSIVQVSGACLLSGHHGVRKQARSLLLAVLEQFNIKSARNAANLAITAGAVAEGSGHGVTNDASGSSTAHGAGGTGDKCEECLALYLFQGVVSSNDVIRSDVYRTVISILDRFPFMIANHVDYLIAKLVKNHPDPPTSAHIDCLYALVKFRQGCEDSVRPALVDYLCKVLEYTLVEGPSATSELACLSVASMTVKSLKAITLNTAGIRYDDARLLKALLCCNLYEYEGLTERGQQTLDALFTEFVLSRSELGLMCADIFRSHHLILMVPLIHLYTLRNTICQDHAPRIAGIIMRAMAASTEHFELQNIGALKPEWREQLLRLMPTDSAVLHTLRAALQESMPYGSQHLRQFDVSTIENANLTVYSGDVSCGNAFEELCKGLIESISQRIEMLPVIAAARMVPLALCTEVFCHARSFSKNFGYLKHLPADYEVRREIPCDLDGYLVRLIDTADKNAVALLLTTLLHMSRLPDKIPEREFAAKFLNPDSIRQMREHELSLVARVVLNCSHSAEIVPQLMDLLRLRLRDPTLCPHDAAKRLIDGLLYHLFGGEALTTQGPAAGIDEHLVQVNRVMGAICGESSVLESQMTTDSLDLIEHAMCSCIVGSLERLLKSPSNNVWTVAEGHAIIFRRCLIPECEKLLEKGLCNVALCILNTGLLPHLRSCATAVQPSAHTTGAAATVGASGTQMLVEHALPQSDRPEWMQKILESNAVQRCSEALLNRLPAGDNAEATVARLCSTVAHILI
ncbi:hypothetical protein, conserved [Babesia bigemina]|uniref:Pre-rRNA-processing protein Ipi1 N-terminal domain-containing protein n=1 Tax=Babesia bigemina TaxID=5866 RepID=A0A061D3A1_BABBI|nr:hypothetical protein, conserved [Babesia bigemina]CDR95221.1 hypothetical protein, conserved [Babesia bigemina]|eukprot:XP_012767407.1 hypothetical protein, conserved [Babesia bigemina]